MSLNATPSANRTRIGIFGRRNAGKSSLINALTGQDLAVVSETKGTTPDPVKKAMELLPLGPVVRVDTPGLDDEGELGQKRMDKALEELRRMSAPMACVLRDGQAQKLPAAQLVPGDVVVLEAGDQVPADAPGAGVQPPPGR